MLPSQFTRPQSSRSHMYRRPRSRRLPLVVALLIVLFGLFAAYRWWYAPNKPAIAQVTIPPAASAGHDNTPPRSGSGASPNAPNPNAGSRNAPVKGSPAFNPSNSKPKQADFVSMAGNPAATPDTGKAGSSNPTRQTPIISPAPAAPPPLHRRCREQWQSCRRGFP